MSKPTYKIDAATARYYTKLNKEPVPEEIYSKILKMSKNGWDSITLDDDFKPNQKKELLTMGFKLKEGNGFLEIIWHD